MSDPYAGRPGFVKGSDTSEAAADSIAATRPSMQRQIEKMIADASKSGMTCSEVEVETGWTHQSASARIRELVLKGQIVDSGLKRAGVSGRYQRVYVIAPQWENGQGTLL